MNLKGKKVVLAEPEGPVAREELAQRLAELGAQVVAAGSERPDVVLAGEVVFSVRLPDLEEQKLGVPILPEAELYEVLLRAEQAGDSGAAFVDHDALAAADPAEVLGLLQEADWAAFAPERDLPPLREKLVALEREHGVTQAHRLATERLVARGARLRHPHAHPAYEAGGSFIDFELSPCGRHLATGRWDMMDAEAGVLQIWELSTGRAVNEIVIDGGVGWSGDRDTVQWSADGTRLAVGFCTNQVGVWDPFGQSRNPFGCADVTDGNDSSATFALAPDGRRAYISMRTGHEVMGCLAALDQGEVVYAHQFQHVEGTQPELLPEPIPEEIKQLRGPSQIGRDGEPDRYEWFFDRVRWSRDGTRLLGDSGPAVCAVDLPGGRMRWFARIGDTHWNGLSMPVAWSPDDRLVAAVARGESRGEPGTLTVLDARTGDQIGESVEQAPGMLHWGMRGDAARLAIVLPDGGGVDVHDEDGRRCHLDIDVTEQIGMHENGMERPWAWDPAGDHGACLTADGQIDVWSLGDEPAHLRSIDAPEETTAVLWGADGVLAVIGENTLRFVRAFTGEVLGDFQLGQESGEEREAEEGDFLGDMFQEDSFPLDESTWCTIAKPAVGPAASLVIAPQDRDADLDAVLAWTVDRRFAWPVRWGVLDIVEDFDAAEAALQG
ncbi:hypothetical protein AB0I53_06340 [Saccharopolyspora sp. NPDC050389]|uniref:hypothetical protein n=1 Tax=Saccharopolyspora sp. NPDC050389 TaxID=3155516 RepID=UPI00340DD465